jgi:hypothetical protein
VVIWVAAILLIIAVALFIAAPLIDPVLGSRRSVISAESERREHEHALSIQALRDLEFDHAMGKLDAADYRVLRERLEPESGVKTHALEPEAVYGTQGMFPGGLTETAGGQVEARSVLSAGELSRHQQNLLAQGLESGVFETLAADRGA